MPRTVVDTGITKYTTIAFYDLFIVQVMYIFFFTRTVNMSCISCSFYVRNAKLIYMSSQFSWWQLWIQQNSFNPSSDYPKTWSFAFYQNIAASIQQANLRDMFKKASNCVCTSTVVVSPDHWSPTPSTSTLNTPGNTQQDPEVPGTADEEDIQMEYSYD